MVVLQFEVYLINLDPTIGSEIQKTRPCVVVSPNEMNRNLNTAIVAPLTSTIKNYPTRVNCIFQRKKGQIALDQIRAIDSLRFVKKMGVINDEHVAENVLATLQQMFA